MRNGLAKNIRYAFSSIVGLHTCGMLLKSLVSDKAYYQEKYYFWEMKNA